MLVDLACNHFCPEYRQEQNHAWLRPPTENTTQFDQLVHLLQKRLGILAYVHRRSTRDVAIKVRCDLPP